jgi:hypothetical protein
MISNTKAFNTRLVLLDKAGCVVCGSHLELQPCDIVYDIQEEGIAIAQSCSDEILAEGCLAARVVNWTAVYQNLSSMQAISLCLGYDGLVEKECPQRLRVAIIMMHDADQPPLISNGLQQLTFLRLWSVKQSPFRPD